MKLAGLVARVRGLAFRLALAYSLLFVLSFATMLGLAYWFGVHLPLSRVESVVYDEALDLSRYYGVGEGRDRLLRALEVRAGAPARRQAYHAFWDTQGRLVAANLPVPPPNAANNSWWRFEFNTFDDGAEEEHETLAYELRFVDGARMLVGRDTEDIDEREELIGQAFAWGSGMALLLGLIGGLLMSFAVGRRIDAVAGTAKRVMAGDLSGRVDVRGTGDDFDVLAETLNAMLDRIEDLIQSVARVSDSVAHELRTPLARLSADLEELRTAPDDAARAGLVTQAIENASRLQSTFDALLRIARVETGRHPVEAHEIDLSALLMDAVELYQPGADDKSIRLVADVAPGLQLRGDRHLLFQAVANLIDNAVKYTPSGGRVEVGAIREGARTRLWVVDDGRGVAAADLPRLTERFYRTPEHVAAEGLGLGLSFVAAVARRHEAQLRLEDNRPGLRVTMEFRTAS